MVEFRKIMDRGKRSARMGRGRQPREEFREQPPRDESRDQPPDEEIREQPPRVAFRDHQPGDRSQDLSQAKLSVRLRDQVHAEHKEDSRENQAAIEQREVLYAQLAKYLKMAFSSVQADKRFLLQPGFKILEKIVASNTPNDALFLKAIHDANPYDLMISPSINVAIFAIKMAANLGFSKTRQVEIGMAALLHDIGMAKIPEALIHKQNLTNNEFLVFKERPKYGYDILQAFKAEHAYLAECALQIHERSDGSGYPLGLTADEIHEYAQIIGLVDIYEALIHVRPQREKILHFYAVKEIIKTGKDKFQHLFLKALLNTFSIFPLNSYVRLNSGAIGRVTRTYPDQPMRPKVQIIYDSQSKKVLADRFINLPEHSLLYIVDAVSEQELISTAEASYLVTTPGRNQQPVPGETDDRPDRHPELDVPDEAQANGAKPTARRTEASSAKSKSTLSKKSLLILAGIFFAAGIASQFVWDVFSVGDKKGALATTVRVVEKVKTGLPVERAVSPEKAAPRVSSDWKQPAKTGGVSSEKTVTDGVRSPESAVPKTGAPTENDDKGVGKPSAAQARVDVETTVASLPANFEKSSPDENLTKEIPPPQPGRYPYSILLSSHRQLSGARNAVAIFKDRGLDPFWIKVDLGRSGIWFGVYNGHYTDGVQARTVVEKFRLEGALVKQTRYANWVAGFVDKQALDQKHADLTDVGFSPYIIQDNEGISQLYVGAFRKVKRAQDQYTSLKKAGVDSRIVER